MGYCGDRFAWYNWNSWLLRFAVSADIQDVQTQNVRISRFPGQI